jgi:hypothetical protein
MLHGKKAADIERIEPIAPGARTVNEFGKSRSSVCS